MYVRKADLTAIRTQHSQKSVGAFVFSVTMATPNISRLLSHEPAPSHTFCCPSSHTSHKHLYLILPS